MGTQWFLQRLSGEGPRCVGHHSGGCGDIGGQNGEEKSRPWQNGQVKQGDQDKAPTGRSHRIRLAEGAGPGRCVQGGHAVAQGGSQPQVTA